MQCFGEETDLHCFDQPLIVTRAYLLLLNSMSHLITTLGWDFHSIADLRMVKPFTFGSARMVLT